MWMLGGSNAIASLAVTPIPAKYFGIGKTFTYLNLLRKLHKYMLNFKHIQLSRSLNKQRRYLALVPQGNICDVLTPKDEDKCKVGFLR